MKRTPLLWLSLVILATGSSAQAADKMKAAAAADWQTSFNQGVEYGHQGDWDKAIESLNSAASMQPNRNEVYTNLALAYLEKKDFDNAVANAQKAVKVNATGAAYHVLGLALEKKGDAEGAVKAYKQGIQTDPKNSDLYLTLGNLYGKQGKSEEATASYEQALKVDEGNVLAYCNLAYLYEEKGDLAKAVQYLTKATEADANDDIAWCELGIAYGKQGNTAKATESYQRSYSLNPNSYKTCLSLALSYEDGGDLEKASEYYTKALSLTDDPKLKEAILSQVSRSGDKN